ncbi:MAG: hypothetical protein AB3N28_04990, partial [Kordiimonas sp.]
MMVSYARKYVVGFVGAAFLTGCVVSDEADLSSEGEVNEAVGSFEVNPEIWPKLTAPVGLDAHIEQRFSTLMSRMSVAEKVG